MSMLAGFIIIYLMGIVTGILVHEKFFPEHKTINEIAKIKNSNVQAELGDGMVCPFNGNCGCTTYCSHFPGRRTTKPPINTQQPKRKGLLKRIFTRGKI